VRLSILVASHGDDGWRELAHTRAIPSALAQDAHEVLDLHDPAAGATRADVRNKLAAQASGDWLCFLDADDELEPGFADAMAAADLRYIRRGGNLLTPPLLTPAIRYICQDGPQEPCFWNEVPLEQGNWMVVGTLVHRGLFTELGGWRHMAGTGSTNEYDDWELWIRCQKAGAMPVKVPAAVYVAHSETSSPSRSTPILQRRAWVNEITAIHFP
jgi:hypothetical protein